MKLIYFIFTVYIFGTFHLTFSDDNFDNLDDFSYENKIVGIYEFDNLLSKKIVIEFEKFGPVCTYNPENYKESMNDNIYRVFIPNTSISDDISTSLDLDVSDSGVEIIFHGKSIEKIIGQFNIIFIIKK